MKKTVYLLQSGILKRQDQVLCFEGAEANEIVSVDDTEEILIYGDVVFDKPLLDFCTEKQIILHFFDYYGYYSGSYYPRLHHNSSYMILKQAEHHTDIAKRLFIAGRLVQGAVLNILHILEYHLGLGDDVERQLREVENLAALIADAREVGCLRDILENARESYYSSLDVMLGLPDFRFLRRSRQPPDDPLNALISFGNSLLYSQTLSEIYQTHLDPRIGFLHDMEFRRFNLHLDLAEVFKPILVGRTIFILLVESKKLTKEDFIKAEDGIVLTEQGKQIFFTEWETRLAKTTGRKIGGQEITYRQLLKIELNKLESHLKGEQEYAPYVHGA